jgi:hypothetical protein
MRHRVKAKRQERTDFDARLKETETARADQRSKFQDHLNKHQTDLQVQRDALKAQLDDREATLLKHREIEFSTAQKALNLTGRQR